MSNRGKQQDLQLIKRLLQTEFDSLAPGPQSKLLERVGIRISFAEWLEATSSIPGLTALADEMRRTQEELGRSAFAAIDRDRLQYEDHRTRVRRVFGM